MKHTQHLYRFKVEILWTGDGDDYDLLINRTRRYGERISVAGYHHGECVARAIDKRRSHRRARFKDTVPLWYKCVRCERLMRSNYPYVWCRDVEQCAMRAARRFRFDVAHSHVTDQYTDRDLL
jgi:hypothetical protein